MEWEYLFSLKITLYSKTCVKQTLSKRPKIDFQDQLSLNAGQNYYSAILSTFIKLPFVIKIFVLSIFEWPFYTGFTVFCFIYRFWKSGYWASHLAGRRYHIR